MDWNEKQQGGGHSFWSVLNNTHAATLAEAPSVIHVRSEVHLRTFFYFSHTCNCWVLISPEAINIFSSCKKQKLLKCHVSESVCAEERSPGQTY